MCYFIENQRSTQEIRLASQNKGYSNVKDIISKNKLNNKCVHFILWETPKTFKIFLKHIKANLKKQKNIPVFGTGD